MSDPSVFQDPDDGSYRIEINEEYTYDLVDFLCSLFESMGTNNIAVIQDGSEYKLWRGIGTEPIL